MAADLFETYVVTVVATMVLASIFFVENSYTMMMFPLAIAGVCAHKHNRNLFCKTW